jgi:hypothetical protein
VARFGKIASHSISSELCPDADGGGDIYKSARPLFNTLSSIVALLLQAEAYTNSGLQINDPLAGGIEELADPL